MYILTASVTFREGKSLPDFLPTKDFTTKFPVVLLFVLFACLPLASLAWFVVFLLWLFNSIMVQYFVVAAIFFSVSALVSGLSLLLAMVNDDIKSNYKDPSYKDFERL